MRIRTHISQNQEFLINNHTPRHLIFKVDEDNKEKFDQNQNTEKKRYSILPSFPKIFYMNIDYSTFYLATSQQKPYLLALPCPTSSLPVQDSKNPKPHTEYQNACIDYLNARKEWEWSLVEKAMDKPENFHWPGRVSKKTIIHTAGPGSRGPEGGKYI